MPGGDERLSQPARRAAAVHRRRLSTSPATCSAATRTASIISSAAPTTCSCRAARTSIRPTSSACWSAIPTSRRRRWCRSTTRSRARSRSRSWSRRPGTAPSEDEIKKFALANAPAYQHPRFVWFVDELPLASTNKIDRNALHAHGGRSGSRRASLTQRVRLSRQSRLRRPAWPALRNALRPCRLHPASSARSLPPTKARAFSEFESVIGSRPCSSQRLLHRRIRHRRLRRLVDVVDDRLAAWRPARTGRVNSSADHARQPCLDRGRNVGRAP